jgi:DNA replication protein DnaC
MKALESKSLVLLRHHLKALRLPTIGAECEKVARRAASDGSDHLTYLLQVTELELLERERKAAERRLKAAHLPSLKSLESFDFAARPSVNKVLVAELARCEFIDRRENVLFVGNPGTGKSHLAIGLSAAACAGGYRVRFFRVTELVRVPAGEGPEGGLRRARRLGERTGAEGGACGDKRGTRQRPKGLLPGGPRVVAWDWGPA